MATMVWKDEYSVGNDLLDEQHKRLIEAVNELNGGAALGEVLATLRQYGDEHFRTEEGMLEASDYPDLDMEGWLCPALFKYFDAAPAHIYPQFKQKAD